MSATPWTKRRPSLRWRVAYLANRLPGRCWADLVSWALRSDGASLWSPNRRCHADLNRHGDCYCGKLRKPGGAR